AGRRGDDASRRGGDPGRRGDDPGRGSDRAGRGATDDGVARAGLSSSFRVDVDWRNGLIAVWLAGVLLLGARIVLMLRATRRDLEDRRPVTHGLLLDRARAIATAAGLKRVPRLSTSARIAGPLTLASGEICVPDCVEHR